MNILFSVVAALFFATGSIVSAGVPAKLPIEGRLANPDGTPLQLANTQIRIQVRSPGAENCMLYSEVFSGINLQASGGRFALTLNAGVGTVESSHAWSFAEAFKNPSTFAAGVSNCQVGSSYTSTVVDSRMIQILVFDGSSWDPFPAYALNSHPFSFQSGNSDSLGNILPSGFLQTDTTTGFSLSQANLKTLFADATWTDLLALLGGTSPKYAPLTAGNLSLGNQTSLQLGRYTSAQQGTLTAGLSMSDAGKTWFNSVTGMMMVWNGSAALPVATGIVGDFRTDGSMAMTAPIRGIAGSNASPGMTFTSDPDTGLYSAGANTLGFATGGSSRMKISSVGDVLVAGAMSVGTMNAPFAMFQVYSASDPGASNSDSIVQNDAPSSAGPTFQLRKSRTGSPAAANDSAGEIRFSAMDSGFAYPQVAVISSKITNSTSGSASGTLAFKTMTSGASGTRMFIAANGNVGIGTTTPSYLLELGTDSAAKPGTSTWTISSDVRLKNIRAPFTRSLAAMEGIETIYFNYKPGNPLGLPSDREYVGIRAQDVQNTIPEAVSTDKDGYLRVTSDAIHWTVFNAVKELYQRWTDDSAEIHRQLAELKARNADLEARLEKLEATK